jgi:hypothetical protein
MRRLSYSLLVLVVILIGLSVYPSVGHAGGPEIREYQSLPTHGATDWEHFSIDDQHYLAVTNYSNDSTRFIDSVIYKYGIGFGGGGILQSIPTVGAVDWEFFTIGSDHYLAVANYQGSSRNVDSKIYKWSGVIFEDFQSIPTKGARDWEFFTIGVEHYLAIANYFDSTGSTYNTNSVIYRWNGTNFEVFQPIATQGGHDWEYFTIGSDHYLVVANELNGSTNNLNSKIYKWNGTNFVEFQSLPTNGGVSFKYFTINGDSYLAVANFNNDITTAVDSKIYRWNGASFVYFQSIPTNGATKLEYFVFSGRPYLAVASSYNGSGYNTDSPLFVWNGANFVEFKSIPSHGGIGWKYFTIGNDAFLALANYHNDSTHNLNSPIFLIKYMVFAPLIVP